MGFVEKMGLPPKPYDKNKDWTPDSLNCEGCQSAFTWINRKHHCRRCGGLFCNNCTLDRVYLRGQGDAPARVCKPCKQIEEAIKFELRHGKSKTPRGSSKPSNKGDNTDALLKQLLEEPHDEEVNVESIIASVADLDRDNDHELHSSSQEKTSVSPTKLHEQAREEKKRYSALKKQGKDAEALKAFKRAKELERQAEAVERELKHQRRVSAGSSSALVSKGSTRKEDPASPDANSSRRKSDPSDNSKKRRAPLQDLGKEKASSTERDDFLNELKALGWSDKEIREADRKPAVKTEEQLLAELAAEVRPKPDRAAATSAAAPGSNDAMSVQIMAHKRQALALKREGKLVEAKDELKKAKILEKQAEEMAFLGQAEGEDEASDDDELRALIRGLEREEKLKGNTGKRGASSQAIPEDFSIFSKFADDDDDDDVEVDDNDLDDPEMAAALRAMGFEEEEEASGFDARSSKPQSRVTKTTEITGPKLKEQILARKRKALALKREGKIAEARAELGEAKKLEMQLENVGKVSSPSIVAQATQPVLDSKVEEEDENVEVTNQDMRDPEMMAALRAMGFEDDEPTPSHEAVTKSDPVEEASLKQQILGIRRQALALKREGRIDEAREALRRAKVLEQQLEDLQAVVQRQEETPAILKQSREARRGAQALPVLSGLLNMDDEGGEEDVEVDHDDLVDPDIAAALAAVGWQEDPADSLVTHPKKDGATAVVSEPTPANLRAADEPQPQEAETKKVKVLQMKKSELTSGASTISATSNPVFSSKTKAELQRELLGRKRRALAFKREGKSEEASIELEEAKIIEKQLAELEQGVAVVTSPTVVAESKPAAAAAVQTAHPPSQQASKHLLKQDSEPSRPIYLDDEPAHKVEVTEDDMQDPAGLGLLGSKEGTVPKKTIPVLDNSGERKPAGRSGNSVAQTGKGGEKLLEFDWGIPHGHAKRTDKETGEKGVTKEQVVKSPLKEKEEDSFEGEYGEIGQTLDVVPPLLGAKDSATPPPQQQRNSWHFGIMDLLSGDRSNPNASQEQPLAIKESQAKILPPLPQVSPKPSERPPADATTSKPTVPPATASLQQEILALKRKARALKREGKAAEAREELRKAKLLEKQTGQQGSEAVVVTSTVAAAGTSSASTHEKVEETSSIVYTTPSRPEATIAVKTSPPSKSPGHKEEMQKQVRQTKDRMKLQQESLAHKRKAMGLRRQGKTEEADAEYELAKELEKQMEDLDPMHGKEELGDVAGVDDLLDPQLLAALKGVGFREGDLTGHKGPANAPAPAAVTAQPRNNDAGSSTSRSSIGAPSNPAGTVALEAEKRQLQEQIRAQKLQAVQLKRAGKQGEALEKLRGAKLLENRLLTLTS